jgi:S-layer homology domain.
MSYVMKAAEFAAKAKDIALNNRTLYVMGGFGAPLTDSAKDRYTGPNAHPYNRRPERTALIRAATADTYAFDCVGLIKALLWSWKGNPNSVYGGATYASNGVPDIDADEMFRRCTEKSANFALDKLVVGEACWKDGHIGIYIGDGLAVECTPAWYDKVQITACNRTIQGYNTRTWTKHGKLPWLDYSVQEEPEPEPTPEPTPEPEPEPQPELKPEAEFPFDDVKRDGYAYPYILRAWQAGIVAGVAPGKFGPKQQCTREMAAAMIMRAADYLEQRFVEVLQEAMRQA